MFVIHSLSVVIIENGTSIGSTTMSAPSVTKPLKLEGVNPDTTLISRSASCSFVHVSHNTNPIIFFLGNILFLFLIIKDLGIKKIVSNFILIHIKAWQASFHSRGSSLGHGLSVLDR